MKKTTIDTVADAETLTTRQKCDWAKVLYTKERLPLKEIAQRIGADEALVAAWKEQYKWEDLRKTLIVTREEQLRRLYDQLDWLTTDIEMRDIKVADSKEADVMNKLTTAIKSLETETSLAEIIDVGKKFLHFLKLDDLEKAKEITRLYDAFVQATLAGKTIN